MNTRQTDILTYIMKHKKVEVTLLSEIFHVSQVTIRKDLNILENQGMIKREHGFACLNKEDDMNTRLAYHFKEKQKIAKKAIESIKDGETVMIESGSCAALVAKELATSRKDITIITNSAFICEFVRKYPVQLILLGGQYQKESQVMVGPLTLQDAKNFFCDKLIIGTDGFTINHGFTGRDLLRSDTVKAMALQCNHVIVVTESEKFGNQGLVHLLDTNKVSEIITDKGIDKQYLDYFLENHIQVKTI